MNPKYFIHVILVLFLNSHWCKCYNILIVLPTTIRSHFNVFNSIVDVLATEHKITFYTVHQPNKNHENITERFILNPHVKKNKVGLFSEIFKKDQFSQLLEFMNYFNKDHFDGMLKENDLNQLINSTEKYDLLIIVNTFSEPLFKLAHVFDVPLIQVVTAIPFPWNNAQINNHNNLGYDISFITSEESYSYTERMKKFIKHMYTWLYYEWIYLPPLEKLTKKYFPPNSPTITEIAKNTEGILVNYISVMGYARPNAPNVLEMGGLHCKPPKKLPEDLEEYISGSGEHGIIYFSLGGTITDLVLSSEVKLAILNVLKKLPQRILWKLDEEMKNLPENIKISKWFPQQDILGHNKTKLFITQGGMLSLQEATYHGVQVLVLPLMGDQFTNGYLAQRKGYGKILTFDKFNGDVFDSKIQELINNTKYRETAKLMSSAIRDQPISTAEKLKHWINFIIRHRNLSILQPMTEHLSLVELMELDIFVTIGFILILIFIVVAYSCLKLFQIIKKIFYRKISIKMKLS